MYTRMSFGMQVLSMGRKYLIYGYLDPRGRVCYDTLPVLGNGKVPTFWPLLVGHQAREKTHITGSSWVHGLVRM